MKSSKNNTFTTKRDLNSKELAVIAFDKELMTYGDMSELQQEKRKQYKKEIFRLKNLTTMNVKYLAGAMYILHANSRNGDISSMFNDQSPILREVISHLSETFDKKAKNIDIKRKEVLLTYIIGIKNAREESDQANQSEEEQEIEQLVESGDLMVESGDLMVESGDLMVESSSSNIIFGEGVNDDIGEVQPAVIKTSPSFKSYISSQITKPVEKFTSLSTSQPIPFVSKTQIFQPKIESEPLAKEILNKPSIVESKSLFLSSEPIKKKSISIFNKVEPAQKSSIFSTSNPIEPAQKSSIFSTNPIENKPLSLFNKVEPIENKPLSLFNKSEPVENKPLSLFNKVEPVENKPLSLFNKVEPVQRLSIFSRSKVEEPVQKSSIFKAEPVQKSSISIFKVQQPSIFSSSKVEQPSIFSSSKVEQPSIFSSSKVEQPSIFSSSKVEQTVQKWSIFANSNQGGYNRSIFKKG